MRLKPSLTIGVLGDIILDQYIIGETNRVSPEAPVLVVSHQQTNLVLGGASNVANNLLGLGATPVLFSVAGTDDAGERLQSVMKNRGLTTQGILFEANRITTEKTRVIANHQQIVRIDHEDAAQIPADLENRLFERVQAAAASLDALIISDYQKGVCTRAIVKRCIDLMNQYDKPVFVDSKAVDYSGFRGAFCVTPNVKETEQIVGFPLRDEAEVIRAAQWIQGQTDIPHVLITRGKDGVTLLSDVDVRHQKTLAKTVFDVSGAGDTVVATLAICILSDLNWEDALVMINLAAGIVIGKQGTVAITYQELAQAYFDSHGEVHEKIWSQQESAVRAADLRNNGVRLTFTNGCFDLLHSGHLHMLRQSKKMGDFLIVGMNSDASVKRLKGDSRPIVSQTDRAMMLASLSFVDAVVIFDEDTPLKTIERIRPDVLVKGQDYQLHQVIGADVVMSYGGRVELIELKKEYSTTGIVNKIKTNVQA